MTNNLGIVGGYFRLLPVIFLERDAKILHLFANSIPPIGVMVCLVDLLIILHKFGIEIPKSVEDAKQIDKSNHNTNWWNYICKEMKNVCVAFDKYDRN